MQFELEKFSTETRAEQHDNKFQLNKQIKPPHAGGCTKEMKPEVLN